MENPDLKPEDLQVETLGAPQLPSPLGLDNITGDGTANYVTDARTVLYSTDREEIVAKVKAGAWIPAFEMAGPRPSIYFDPSRVRAAVVTCGGLCPGINNVIRALVMELHYRYSVHSIIGIDRKSVV
jgi:6-phosphofructokinase 1